MIAIALDKILNRAESGLVLARLVLDAIREEGSCALDFQPADRMTPSFANAFVMTVMQACPAEILGKSLIMLNRNEQVILAMSESQNRFSRGLRLTSQLAPALASP